MKKVLSLLLLFAVTFASAREILPLNEGWQFKKGPFPTDPMKLNAKWSGKWETVNIPHTWNARDMQSAYNNFYQGAAYYRRTWTAPDSLRGKRVFLRFEGVGACAEVYVNGGLVGTHKGGYSAFAFDMTENLKVGAANEIVVRADNASRPDVIPVNHTLFGVYGGIYRPVSVIITEDSHIAVTDNASPGVFITQRNVSKRGADVSVRVELDNDALHAEKLTLTTRIEETDGRTVAENVRPISLTPQGLQTFTADFHVKRPRLWQGRKDPYLYRVRVQLRRGGQVIDEMIQPLGLRHFEMVAGKGFFLNGEPYPMYGVCRHQDWEGLGSALTREHHAYDLSEIMEMGATTVRFAHYQQAEYIYSKCDSLGLVIWAEIPFVNRVTGEEAENAKSQLRELIRQNFNHPSIYVWGLHNEVYHPHAYTARLTAELHRLAKAEDPDRYTASVNGYGHVEHPVNLNADIQAMNRYYGWYEGKISDIDRWADGLEKNYSDLRLIFSEYGAEANLKHQTELLGESLRWWGDTYYPETYQTKMHEYQWGCIARHPVILASYLWNTFDFATPMTKRTDDIPARNTKGLITFDRKTRKDAFYWYKANWNPEPMVYITQRRNTERERRTTTITVYSNAGTPRVTLNGQPVEGMRQGYTKVHYVFEGVTLADGKNVIRAEVPGAKETLTDEIVWNYTGEKNRAPEGYENKGTHSGL